MKKKLRNIQILLVAAFTIAMINSCVEPFSFDSETFESALVVQATITDKMIQHEVLLYKTHPIDEDEPIVETNATVLIIDDIGRSYPFVETAAGSYLAVDAFAAEPNRQYQLKITLSDGKKYTSSFQSTPAVSSIERVYADRITNDQGFDGVSIIVDSNDPTNQAKYFRFQYEETYKLIVPEWKTMDLIILVDDAPDCFVGTVQRPIDQLTCFVSPTRKTSGVLDVSNLSDSQIIGYSVRFISSENYKMASRYSILVRQLVQTREANAYFATLDKFNDAGGNIFSQSQTGFVEGNIKADTNVEEPVIGFFEVATLSEKRIFFNYTDFYYGEALPPYFIDCTPIDLRQSDSGGCSYNFYQVGNRNLIYYDEEEFGEPPFQITGYRVVFRLCGDCTAVGTPEIPDFWEE